MDSLELIVNGKPLQVQAPAPTGAGSANWIDAVLHALGAAPEQGGLAIAVNGEVAPRSQWPELTLQAGDRIEVVHARQGG